MSLGKKLGLSFGAVMALMLLVSVVSLTTQRSLNQSFERAANQSATKLVLLGRLMNAGTTMVAMQRGSVVYSMMKQDATRDQMSRNFQAAYESASGTLKELRGLQLGASDASALDRIEESLKAWSGHFQVAYGLCTEGKPEEAFSLLIARTVPLFQSIAREGERATSAEQRNLAAEQKTAAAQFARSRVVNFSTLFLAALLSAAGIVIIRGALRDLRGCARELADGAGQVAGAAGQVSSASQSLAQGASEQAASLEETSASTEELASMTTRNAENAQAAAGLAAEAAERVGGANRYLAEMIASMDEINASSGKISKIIRVIDEIAFQTNILALNAAVEAARAGEAGMGFAVVADEVRNLAQRCAQAARDTSALIEESISRSTSGHTRLGAVAKSIDAITESAGKVKILVDEINTGSQEQARGIEQVAKAVSQMQEVTQRNAANAEEGAAASEELSAQAATTNTVVGKLLSVIGRTADLARHDQPRPAPANSSAGLAGLAALSTAVTNRPVVPRVPSPSLAATRQAFPLDDD